MAFIIGVPLDTNIQSAKNPVLADRKSPSPGVFPLMTGGDNPRIRIYFTLVATGSLTPASLRMGGMEITLAGKRDTKAVSPYLYYIPKENFTEGQEEDGYWYYEADLDLNTVELMTLVDVATAEFATFCDVEIRDPATGRRQTHQFKINIRPQVWREGAPPPEPVGPIWPDPEDIEVKSNKGVANGYAPLNGDINVPPEFLPPIATARLRGRVTAGTGPVEDLTVTQAKTLLGLPTSATAGNIATLDASGNPTDSGKAASTDGTLASNSDAKLPTEKAIKTYAAKKAANPNFASSGEAVDGADVRLGINGGLTSTNANSGSTGNVVTLRAHGAGEWHFFQFRAATSGSNAGTFTLCGSGGYVGGFCFRAETTGLKVETISYGFSGLSTGTASGSTWSLNNGSLVDGNIHWAGVRVSGTTVQVMLENGTVHSATTSSPIDPSGVVSNLFYGLAKLNAAGNTLLRYFATNFQPTLAEIRAAMSGLAEAPAYWQGGIQTESFVSMGYTDGFTASGGTVTTNAGGILEATCTGAQSGAAMLQWRPATTNRPLALPGRVARVYYKLTNLSGSPTVALGFHTLSNNIANVGTALVADGTNRFVDITYSVNATSNGPVADFGFYLECGSSSGSFRFEAASCELQGLATYVGPEDWTSARGLDRSGNANDFIIAAMSPVVPRAPRTHTRVINAQVAGATIAAGTVASLGTVSGKSFRDNQALLALRQWDVISACWRQSRPTNAGGVVASATANGTLLLETSAHTSNATVAASTAVGITVTL